MASRSDSVGSVRPRVRRSIAHVPRSRLMSGLDKENTTTDIGAVQPNDGRAKPAGKDKKSRSKSLGPGGLDALQDSNGNRRKSTAAFPLKSILKPTVPVSPVRNIPSFEETRRRTPARGAQQNEENNEAKGKGNEAPLIDFDTPAQASTSGTENKANPFDSFNASSAIRDAREREETEKKERERKMILEKREARRKSMANRRVSFAPEATLHTWNVVEIPDDSTASSASNSTRRASSLTNSENQTPAHVPKQKEPPSTPDTEAESDIAFSPVEYPVLQELKSRSNSSGGYDGAGAARELSSSPFSGSSADGLEDTGLQDLAKDDDDDDDDDNSSVSAFDGESTAMSLDDMSVHSAATVQSDGSDASSSSSARLNEALRQAAREAGTRGIDFDEDGEMSMEIADQEITGAFQPWIKKGQRQSFDWGDISASHDQENIYPLKQSPQDTAIGDPFDNGADEDLSMEVTNAIGHIIQPSRRQSTVRRKSSGEETNYEEQTMEFTNVIGGIAQSTSPAKSIGADSDANDDEEMTMEFTSVVGGVLNKPSHSQSFDENSYEQAESHAQAAEERNFSDWNDENEEYDMEEGADMEMTGAVGGILAPIEEQPEEEDDQTLGMDVTTAMGKILQPGTEAIGNDQAEKAMELESNSGQLGSSPFQESIRRSPAKSPLSFHVAAVASESGSPSLASVRSRSTRQSLGRRMSNTSTSKSPRLSPAKKTVTPPKQLMSQASGSLMPGKTPPSNKSLRSASPKKLFQPEIRESASNRRSSARKSIFGHNATTGESAPLFVLRPPEKRRSSGLGIDKEGLGSPRVAAMLDKRRSIGEEAPQFIPKKEGVRFEDPLKLQEEVDREREEEEYREDGHIPPLQPDQLDGKPNIRDMISSLTPKKNKLHGRKSLHVGAARGLLGKRPIELDEDEAEQEANSTPKRFKGRDARDVSPVKSIKLPPPPTMDETVGHLARSPTRKSTNASSAEASTTPRQEPKSSYMRISPTKDAAGSSNVPADSETVEEETAEIEDPDSQFEPIQLQEFLNMTNIHFMELTTTKRRHTTAPGSSSRRSTRLSIEAKSSFEDTVAAGFCTVPMLELYQHSCRELKSYISEGRQVIRSIETETYAENPPLFREYMTAPPDIRLLMDNQFRNVKTHARLLSKATWYEWRMKLLEGLKEGLNRHVEEMKADDVLLSKHEELLNEIAPSLVEKHSSLEEQATSLQQLADELENCDQDELRNTREKLSSIENEIALKKQQLEELQEELQDKTDTIETGAELKAEFMAQIQEAERVKEECRGWSAKEISQLKDSVHSIERRTGWSIISATSSSGSSTGPLLTMSYRNQLQLMFHPGALYIENAAKLQSNPDEKMNMPLELTYSPKIGTKSTVQAQLSPIALLVLKSLQNHFTTLQQSTIAPKQLLQFISKAWDVVLSLEEEARMLQFCGVTKLKLSEVEDKPSLRARCTLLGASPSVSEKKSAAKSTSPENKRIDVDFAVKACVVLNGEAGAIGVMDFKTDVIASKVYGFGTGNDMGMSEKEIQNILCNELGENTSGLQLGNGVWSKAVQTLTGTVF